MQSNWEKQFYKEQFEMIHSENNQPEDAYFKEVASLIHEQVGRPFDTVLELGAGRGEVANEMARLGKKVTTIELVEEISQYATLHAHKNVEVMCADFYKVNLSKQFDAVLYLDGFGVGTDTEQLHLLQRINEWMTEDGYALIDIYQPLYWEKISGIEMYPLSGQNIKRQYGFTPSKQRMTDTWWSTAHPEQSYTQSLACYSPDQIHALCEKTGFQIVAYYPGGAMNFETGVYQEITTLDECLSYRIKIKKN